jgi:hypothetical protein
VGEVVSRNIFLSSRSEYLQTGFKIPGLSLGLIVRGHSGPQLKIVAHLFLNPICLVTVLRLQHKYLTFTRIQYQVNVKVKLFLCFAKHHAMKVYWEMEV